MVQKNAGVSVKIADGSMVSTLPPPFLDAEARALRIFDTAYRQELDTTYRTWNTEQLQHITSRFAAYRTATSSPQRLYHLDALEHLLNGMEWVNSWYVSECFNPRDHEQVPLRASS